MFENRVCIKANAMSSRVLRKLQGDNKELPDEVSDNEGDVSLTGGARKKQFNINRYDLVSEINE